ncbi:unnamed protein product [Blepharisma stoltei]|uniref:PARP-type domain-containing protein n=1 Tax=Blepharisma stoltei TaxID=1481888 RepID=A0AAU9K036_9CILI|nr:unnamed protein product [Blepharisma stoltei]
MVKFRSSHQEMKRVSFTAEIAQFNKTSCKLCKSIIEKGALRIKTHSYNCCNFFHLNCYTPSLKQYISKSDLCIKLDSLHKKVLDDWLNNWNQNYLPLDKPYHEPPKLFKLINSKSSKFRRSWIEIFKYSTIKDLVRKFSRVNKEFYHISWDEELWQFFCIRDFSCIVPKDTYRNQYVTILMEICFGCKAVPKAEHFYRCPLIGRPLCPCCRFNDKKFIAVTGPYIERAYNIDPKVLDLKFGQGYDNKKITYNFLVWEALAVYREKNKNDLLDFMKDNCVSDKLICMVEKISTKEMDYTDIFGRIGANFDSKIIDIWYQQIFSYIRNGEGGSEFKQRLLKNEP